MNAPVYTIGIRAIDLVARIAEKVGELKGSGEYGRNLQQFMLSAILQALEEFPARKITDIFTDKLSKAELEFLEQIAGYLDKNDEITNYRAQLLTNKSDVSVKKYFAKLVEIGILKVEWKNKGRKYLINRDK
ncbi:MAG: hypothetical protein LBK47_07680 [Prevotellaceae bacterium]|jgi:Fic family protein|nr:hypothetical protein [Prevotellaceae bacterium]